MGWGGNALAVLARSRTCGIITAMQSPSGELAMGAIAVPQEAVSEFCRRNHIRRLSLFGPVLRADFRPDSDVDVLAEFAPDATVGLFELHRMEQELSRLFGARKVDLNTPMGLSQYFRDEVLEEAEVQYVEA
jgi:predicted nucleotidyltransferase